MPPRHQLDEISEAIGEVRAYVHEGRHGINNLSQKVDAMRVGLGKDMASVEARIEAKVDTFMQTTNRRLEKLEFDANARLKALEDAAAKEAGARGIVNWLIHSPLIGWLAAAASVLWAAMKVQGK